MSPDPAVQCSAVQCSAYVRGMWLARAFGVTCRARMGIVVSVAVFDIAAFVYLRGKGGDIGRLSKQD